MKTFFIFCALCCFIAALNFPIAYYTFLRVLISLGCILGIYNFTKQKKYSWIAVLFIMLLILFNPILPIYLHRKGFWIPMDIIAGLLFLLIGFYCKIESKKNEEKALDILPIEKIYSRDRIV
ncbi:DUF6804 family protein [Pedobacter nototheniae]|uniref:DUF6804 family protein n=1 Tax=Pedobacter nototheniae TaxID=2488994 RepID=UPI00292DF922|nr:DUF6804 family protein [Pedobacter nototheniae]